MDQVVSSVQERVQSLLGPLEDIWIAYQGLDPEQQKAVLVLVPAALGALVVYGMYQAHGDRVVVVLPAMLLRYSLLMLALPVVMSGKLAGAGWTFPEFLRRDWTAEPDPDRPEIAMREANPMQLPGRLPTTRESSKQTEHKNRNRRR